MERVFSVGYSPLGKVCQEKQNIESSPMRIFKKLGVFLWMIEHTISRSKYWTKDGRWKQ